MFCSRWFPRQWVTNTLFSISLLSTSPHHPFPLSFHFFLLATFPDVLTRLPTLLAAALHLILFLQLLFSLLKNHPLVQSPHFLSCLLVRAPLPHLEKWLLLLPMSPTPFLSTNIATTMTVDRPRSKGVDFFMSPSRWGNWGFCFEAVVLAFTPSPPKHRGGKSPTSPSCGEVQAAWEARGMLIFHRALAMAEGGLGSSMPRSSWQHAPWWALGCTPRQGKRLPSVCPSCRGPRKARLPGKQTGLRQPALQVSHPQRRTAGWAKPASLDWECGELDPGPTETHLPGRLFALPCTIFAPFGGSQLGATGDSCLWKGRWANSIMRGSLCQGFPNLAVPGDF